MANVYCGSHNEVHMTMNEASLTAESIQNSKTPIRQLSEGERGSDSPRDDRIDGKKLRALLAPQDFELKDQGKANSFCSPPKVAKGKGSFKVAELVTKRSPTAIFDFEAHAASDSLDLTLTELECSLLSRFSSFDDFDVSLLFGSDEEEDGSPVDRSLSTFSDTSDLTNSTYEKEDLAPTTPKRQLSKNLIQLPEEFFKSVSTPKSVDSSPRMPKRTVSPKLRRRATLGDIPTSKSTVPAAIVCLPQDASPTKPSRQLSDDSLHRPARHSCPDPTVLLSLQEALLMNVKATEQRLPRRAFKSCESMETLPPMKPTRKISIGNSSE